MVHRFNHCEGSITVSGSSSCSEFKVQEKCNNCQGQCELINNRNYGILKKICRKIFKEYNRSKCREKYRVFEGGNSVSVRIHRSGSRGDGIGPIFENCENKPDVKCVKSLRGVSKGARNGECGIGDTRRKGKRCGNRFSDTNVCKAKSMEESARNCRLSKREGSENCRSKRSSKKSNNGRNLKGNKDDNADNGDSAKYIITDLRKKVRRGERVGLENKTKKGKGKNNYSRSDEVKACDYLRAQMEERDLCKLCCCPPPPQCCPPSPQCCPINCYPKMCIPNIECNPKTCK